MVLDGYEVIAPSSGPKHHEDRAPGGEVEGEFDPSPGLVKDRHYLAPTRVRIP